MGYNQKPHVYILYIYIKVLYIQNEVVSCLIVTPSYFFSFLPNAAHITISLSLSQALSLLEKAAPAHARMQADRERVE